MGILDRIQGVFCDIFDDETLVLTRETTANDIEKWDSLAQINIIVACEAEFGVRFDLNDIADLKNVGDILDLVERKLK